MDKTPIAMVIVRFYYKVKSLLFGEEMTKAQNSIRIAQSDNRFIFHYLEDKSFKLAMHTQNSGF